MNTLRIILFAKAPQAGFAKTRLIPFLGAEGAAELARRMLINTLREACNADIGPVELCVTPNWGNAAWRTIAVPAGVDITEQGEGDLGARMARASERALMKSRRVLLIGTDCVEMKARLLREAANTLRTHDAAIYNTADGGYALLGLTRFAHLIFSDIRWSTATVASETIARINHLGWSLHLGTQLHDVDEPADLALLPKEMVPDALV